MMINSLHHHFSDREESLKYFQRRREVINKLSTSIGRAIHYFVTNNHSLLNIMDLELAIADFLAVDIDIAIERLNEPIKYNIDMLVEAQKRANLLEIRIDAANSALKVVPIEQQEIIKLSLIDPLESQLEEAKEWLEEVQRNLENPGVKDNETSS